MALAKKHAHSMWLSIMLMMTSYIGITILLSGKAAANVTTVDVNDHFSQLALSSSPPQIYQRKVRENGITELFIQGEEYQGKPTRIFALYRVSATPLALPSGKMPAVVLVHGGGGTAFETWVRKWNEAGFAAISVAVEGQIDARPSNFGKNKKGRQHWQRHGFAGPARANIYGDSDKEITQQWMFHAVAASIRAKQFLQSQQKIDIEHIGISGISWGGVITSTVIGFDPSFSFAIPIYGCGFLDLMENQYQVALKTNKVYKRIWEPGIRISGFTHPSLWLTWRDDKHFALNSQAKTYNSVAGPVSISIKPSIKHGHVPAWEQAEPYVFAQKVTTRQPVLISQSTTLVSSDIAKASFTLTPSAYSHVASATIHYTSSDTHTGQANWLESTIPFTREVSASEHRVTALFKGLPTNVTHWFINLNLITHGNHSTKGLHFVVSSKLVSSK